MKAKVIEGVHGNRENSLINNKFQCTHAWVNGKARMKIDYVVKLIFLLLCVSKKEN